MGSYDEQDLKRIIRRAAELQQRASGPDSVPSRHTELSLDELQEIAREMGVSPDFVREAAMEYEGIPVEEPLMLDTGDKYKKELIGFVKGELDKKTWAEIRSIIEYHFDAPGKVNRRPRGIKWKAEPIGISKWLATRKTPEVEIKTEGNRTSIRIKKSLKTYQKLTWPAWAALGIAFMMFAVMMSEGAGGGEEVFGFMVGIGFMLGMAQLFRKWADRKVRKGTEQLKEVMEQLQTIVARRYRAGSKHVPEQAELLTDHREPSLDQQERSGRKETGQETGRSAREGQPGTQSHSNKPPERGGDGATSRLQNVLKEKEDTQEERSESTTGNRPKNRN